LKHADVQALRICGVSPPPLACSQTAMTAIRHQSSVIKPSTHPRCRYIRRLVVSSLSLGVNEHLVLCRFLVLPVEDDELTENEQVEEDGETGSCEPRSVGEQVSRPHRDDENGEHIGDVCQSALGHASEVLRLTARDGEEEHGEGETGASGFAARQRVEIGDGHDLRDGPPCLYKPDTLFVLLPSTIRDIMKLRTH
jgi:hypothetical protein